MYFDFILIFFFSVFYMVSAGEGRGEAPRERGAGVTFWSAGERKKESKVSLLLVALLTRPALGQYLITSTAEQHAISTY